MRMWISHLTSQIELIPSWALLAAIVAGAIVAALAVHRFAFLLLERQLRDTERFA